MIYLIFFIVFALIVGPILMSRPTEVEKRLSTLRQTAVSAGLIVQVPLADELDWCRGVLHVQRERLVRYMRPLNIDKSQKERVNALVGLYVFDPDNIAWSDNSGRGIAPCLQGALTALYELEAKQWKVLRSPGKPLQAEDKNLYWFIALEITPVSLGLYWMENGPEACVAAIAQALEDIDKVLVSK